MATNVIQSYTPNPTGVQASDLNNDQLITIIIQIQAYCNSLEERIRALEETNGK